MSTEISPQEGSMSSHRLPSEAPASASTAIDRFAGRWFFLSNYYPAPVWMDGEIYPSVEHAYQAAKTFDSEIRAAVRETADPDEAKRLGRAAPQRPDWEEVKVSVMRVLVEEKFRDSALAARLLDTGHTELVEGNDWGDEFWGRCDGCGDNTMGRILMETRTVLRSEQRITVAQVHRVAEAELPTNWGSFRIIGYRGPFDGCEHVAIVVGDVQGAERVLVRVHSECLTGEVFGSRRCDCGPQLKAAMRATAAEGVGVVLYLRGHEGRGIGLLAKLRAYQLQDDGHDTVDANLALGVPADARDYRVGAQILADLGVVSLRLLSNNPTKCRALIQHGVHVVERVPLITRSTPENARYMRVKRDRMGHDLPESPETATGSS